jgi:5-formyltetrahydrofolate cyclo-ligase
VVVQVYLVVESLKAGQRLPSYQNGFIKAHSVITEAHFIMTKLFYKPEVREKMQRRRKALDLISIAQAAQAVAAQAVMLNEFISARHIGAYLAIENELDPLPILHCAHTLSKSLYLPIIKSSKDSEAEALEFHRYTVGDPLLKGVHGISAPAHRLQLPQDVTSLDLILLPLVAFDSSCNRLGRGAGHYDRTLNVVKERSGRLPCLIGLAYEFQKIPEIAADKWDVPMDIVITEKNIYRRS